MTATPPWPTVTTFPVFIRRRESGRIRGKSPACGDVNDGLGPVRRQTHPRSLGPRKSGNTLVINRLANNYSGEKTMHVACYGYRWYDPLTGRWPSRDPIVEKAFFDEYFSKLPEIFDGKALEIVTRGRAAFPAGVDIPKLFWENVAALKETRQNAYSFVKNNSIDSHDNLGLLCCYGCIAKLIGQIEWLDADGNSVGPDTCEYDGRCWEIGETCNGSFGGAPDMALQNNPNQIIKSTPVPANGKCPKYWFALGIYYQFKI